MARKVQHEFTVARREPRPAGSLSSWQWIHESRLSRMACDECDAPGSGVELGTLARVAVNAKGARRADTVVLAVCLPCARKMINAI